MNPFLIANPPVGIYRGDLPLGYAYVNVLLDIQARHQRNKGRDVVFHKYSLNALGRRAEQLGLDGSLQNLRNYVEEWIEKSTLRDRIGLSSEGTILDCDESSIRQAQKTFVELYDNGFVSRINGAWFLNLQKLKKERDLSGMVEQVEFFPKRAKREFERIIFERTSPVRITKDRKYSASNPLGGEPLSPIFVVSSLWEAYSNRSPDLMASAEKELGRYLALRFLTRAGVSDEPPMQRIFVYNLLEFKDGLEDWFANTFTGGVDSDFLRYAFSKSVSTTKQKVSITKSSLLGGRNFVYLIGNIKNFFLRRGIASSPLVLRQNRGEYLENMDSFRFSSVLSNLERGFRNVSASINSDREQENLESNLEQYLSLVLDSSPFCPFITSKVLDELKVSVRQKNERT